MKEWNKKSAKLDTTEGKWEKKEVFDRSVSAVLRPIFCFL